MNIKVERIERSVSDEKIRLFFLDSAFEGEVLSHSEARELAKAILTLTDPQNPATASGTEPLRLKDGLVALINPLWIDDADFMLATVTATKFPNTFHVRWINGMTARVSDSRVLIKQIVLR